MAARSSDDIPCDTRHMKAHWFWTLVNRNEDIGLDLLKNNHSLVFLPMDYDCRCEGRLGPYTLAKDCVLDIEELKDTTPSALKQMYQSIKGGLCNTDLHGCSPMDECWTYDTLDNRLKRMNVNDTQTGSCSSHGTFCLSIAVALDKRNIVRYIHLLGRSVFNSSSCKHFCFTIGHRFSYIYTAVVHRRTDILNDVLLDMKCPLVNFEANFQFYSQILIQRDDAKMFKIFLQAFNSPAQSHFIELLTKMHSFNAYPCLEVVVKSLAEFRHHCPFPSITYVEGLESICKDNVIMNQLLKEKLIQTKHVMRKVLDGDYDLAESTIVWALEEFKPAIMDDSLLVQATLSDLPDFLTILLDAKIKVVRQENKTECGDLFTRNFVPGTVVDDKKMESGFHTICNVRNRSQLSYTPLDWAIALNFEACKSVLIKFSQPSNPNVYGTCHPLMAIPYIASVKYDAATLALRLISNGFTVQQCMSIWKQYPTTCSPIYFAVLTKDEALLTLLLSHGIDLEVMYDVFNLPLSSSLLRCFLYHNANICNENGSVVNQIMWLSDKSEASRLLHTVMDTAYIIPRQNIDNIAKFCDHHETGAWFRLYMSSANSLMWWCRKSFRKYCGYQIHAILRGLVLPSRVKGYLLLQSELEVLDPYRQNRSLFSH